MIRRAILPLVLAASVAEAQRPTLAATVRQFVSVDTAIVALTHVRVIDGTGAAPRESQTLIIRDGSIAALGDDGKIAIPGGALVIDETGKSVIPGMVQVHEHLFYPTGPVSYTHLTLPTIYSV